MDNKRLIIYRKVLLSLLAAWVAVWAFFIARELFAKGQLKDYRELLSRNLEGKRSYTAGDRLYEFIAFCNENIPEGSTYRLIGPKYGSHDTRRFTYYLYPNVEKEPPEYIFVYDGSPADNGAYEVFKRLDGARYIMRRKR